MNPYKFYTHTHDFILKFFMPLIFSVFILIAKIALIPSFNPKKVSLKLILKQIYVRIRSERLKSASKVNSFRSANLLSAKSTSGQTVASDLC